MHANISTPINLIIADDHPMLLRGFASMLRNVPGFTLLAEVSNGYELVDQTRKLLPDIIITDINMPVLDGIGATRKILSEFPAVGIIAFSMFDTGSMIIKIIEAGARGYLLKNADMEEIINAIRLVHNGGSYYTKNITAELAKMVGKLSVSPAFSEREIAVMRLICEERSNKQIAGELHLSKRTIDWYKERLLEKLDAKNTAGIVAYAVKNNICG